MKERCFYVYVVCHSFILKQTLGVLPTVKRRKKEKAFSKNASNLSSLLDMLSSQKGSKILMTFCGRAIAAKTAVYKRVKFPVRHYLSGPSILSIQKEIKEEYFHNNRYPTILSVVYITAFLCIVWICLTTSLSEDSDFFVCLSCFLVFVV